MYVCVDVQVLTADRAGVVKVWDLHIHTDIHAYNNNDNQSNIVCV